MSQDTPEDVAGAFRPGLREAAASGDRCLAKHFRPGLPADTTRRSGVSRHPAIASLVLGWLGCWLSAGLAAEPVASQLTLRLPPVTATTSSTGTPAASLVSMRTYEKTAAPVVLKLLPPGTQSFPVVRQVPLPEPPEAAEAVPPASPSDGMRPVSPPTYGDSSIRPIGSLTVNIIPSKGSVPREVNPTRALATELGANEFQRMPLNYSYYWASPAFFHQPLYFEQPNLERYGYTYGPLFQPWVSGAQFFIKIPLLPYMMAVHPTCEHVYSLGYYRPGSCAPYQFNWPDVRLGAAVVEGAFITGLCFLIP